MSAKRIILFFALLLPVSAWSQHSVARQWNEVLLEAIRGDYARPTVHARNLFHSSVLMYDAWAVYEEEPSLFFLGQVWDGYTCLFAGVPRPSDKLAAQQEVLSYAMYGLLKHRFKESPGAENSLFLFDSLMLHLGYDITFVDNYYHNGNPAALGNYLAEQMIQFGFQDGANEQNDYDNRFYWTVNRSLAPVKPGNRRLDSVNRWQALALDTFVDQGGHIRPGFSPPFLSPEWGQVSSFSLKEEDRTDYYRDRFDWWVFHDPGPPPYLDTVGGLNDYYKWTFSLVSTWSAHLDTTDGVLWDISPKAIGNVQEYPTDEDGMRAFYDLHRGGDPGQGYAVNPHTGAPYQSQWVPRGDYARVLAEFWADGPDSETPPGHWFTILNYVNDHPDLEHRFQGEGPILDPLEWDVKSYFALGGAMHDAAITAWGCKGWYDYIRPISAIRYMADQGQSSDPNLPSYDPHGIPLIPGYIELIDSNDAMAVDSVELVGKIKLWTWRGPDYIDDPEVDMAGVGWILAEHWWPYQRPTFVTPPFAGYVSGHSTYSRAGAEILARFTGDEYFPGGMGEFHASKNEFLVFEEGPSVEVVLQWAKYTDASDQCSLSRIWGGIHPPVDDIPGRIMGEKVGIDAFDFAKSHFEGTAPKKNPGLDRQILQAYPNPSSAGQGFYIANTFQTEVVIQVLDLNGVELYRKIYPSDSRDGFLFASAEGLKPGLYMLRLVNADQSWGQLVELR